MNLHAARALARTLMTQHGVADWGFKFDKATKRLGLTRFGSKSISISKALTALNPEPQVRDTLLHEIAHALVGYEHHHDSVWRSKALEIGCSGERSSYVAVEVKAPYTVICGHCGASWGTFRKRSVVNMWHNNCGRQSINRLAIV